MEAVHERRARMAIRANRVIASQGWSEFRDTDLDIEFQTGVDLEFKGCQTSRCLETDSGRQTVFCQTYCGPHPTFAK